MTAARNVAAADTTTARSSGRSDVFAGQGMRSMRPKSNAPTASQRNVWNIDTSAATRGVRDWRQDGGETTSKTPQLPRGASVALRGGRSPPRAFLGWESRDCTRARGGGRFDILPKRRCSFRSSVLSPLYWFLRRFFSSSCSAAEHKASQCVQAHIPQSTALLPRLLRKE